MGWQSRLSQARGTYDRGRTQRYGEAFLLMHYQCVRVSTHTELVWNSRDGITPFNINCRECDDAHNSRTYSNLGDDTHPGVVFMQHVRWNDDTYQPNYNPPVGSRVFVNLTMENAIRQRTRFVEQCWDDTPHEDTMMSPPTLGQALYDRFAGDKQKAIEELARMDMQSYAPTTPDLVTVQKETR